MKKIHTSNILENINPLVQHYDFPAISIYLNTSKQWHKNEKAQIKLKNILSDVRNKLLKHGLRNPEIDELFDPIKKETSFLNFFASTTQATAFFISNTKKFIIKLRDSTISKNYINNYFHIKLLTNYIFEKQDYYVLAISTNKNYLYKCENSSCELLDESKKLPESMEDAQWMKEGEKSIQFNESLHIAKGYDGGLIYHGHGAYKDNQEVLLKRYLEKVDKKLNKIIKDYQVPLVIISSDTIFSLYKQVNTYPNLLTTHISGNPDNKQDRNKLLKKVWPVVKKSLTKDKENLIKDFKNNRQLALENITEIVRAAYNGKVDKLFLNLQKEQWGKFNTKNNTVAKHGTRQLDSQDLTNLAALFTIKNSGSVYTVSADQLKLPESVGVLLRF